MDEPAHNGPVTRADHVVATAALVVFGLALLVVPSSAVQVVAVLLLLVAALMVLGLVAGGKPEHAPSARYGPSAAHDLPAARSAGRAAEATRHEVGDAATAPSTRTMPPAAVAAGVEDAPAAHEASVTAERPGIGWVVTTFALVGLGIVFALTGSLEALVLSIPLFLAALVTGIVGAVVSHRHRPSTAFDGQTAASVAGSAIGLGAAVIATIVAIMVIIAMVLLYVAVCVMTFGLACG